MSIKSRLSAIFDNHAFNPLRMQGLNKDSNSAPDNRPFWENMGKSNDRASRALYLSKNIFLASINVVGIILALATGLEFLALFSEYMIPALIVVGVSAVSPSFRKFVSDCADKIYKVTTNNMRLIALALALPFLLKIVSTALGLRRLSFALLKEAENLSLIESLVSITFGFSATLATLFPATVNNFLAKLGLIKQSSSTANSSDQETFTSKFWNIAGVLGSIVLVASFQPTLLFGIAATSMVCGLGLVAGEYLQSIFGASTEHNHNGADTPTAELHSNDDSDAEEKGLKNRSGIYPSVKQESASASQTSGTIPFATPVSNTPVGSPLTRLQSSAARFRESAEERLRASEQSHAHDDYCEHPYQAFRNPLPSYATTNHAPRVVYYVPTPASSQPPVVNNNTVINNGTPMPQNNQSHVSQNNSATGTGKSKKKKATPQPPMTPGFDATSRQSAPSPIQPPAAPEPATKKPGVGEVAGKSWRLNFRDFI